VDRGPSSLDLRAPRPILGGVPAARRQAPPPGLAYDIEARLAREGFGAIAGVDEVGRGPLAGPVVAAAVVLDPARVPEGLADSKTLSAPEREALFELIVATASVGLAAVPHDVIDHINIRRATHLAMARALAALPVPPGLALVDGNDLPDLPCPARTVVRGDATVASIAAASIVAKVTRDRTMRRLDAWHPAYGFARHVGYPTAAHRAALVERGPCRFHRTTFGAVGAAGSDETTG
jgi:ribonuclease HII